MNTGPKPANQTILQVMGRTTHPFTHCTCTLVFAERQTLVESATDERKQQTASRHARMARLLLLHGTFFRGINIISDPAVYRKKTKTKNQKNSVRGNVCKTIGPKPIKLASNKIWIKCKGRLAWACTSHAHNTIDPLQLFST